MHPLKVLLLYIGTHAAGLCGLAEPLRVLHMCRNALKALQMESALDRCLLECAVDIPGDGGWPIGIILITWVVLGSGCTENRIYHFK